MNIDLIFSVALLFFFKYAYCLIISSKSSQRYPTTLIKSCGR